MKNNLISDLGKRGVLSSGQSGPARCGLNCAIAGNASPSSSDCYIFGTWNVRSLHKPGKLPCVIQEMEKLNVDLLGVSETYWPNAGEFMTSIPTSDQNYKVIYSGGEKHRRGVGFIINKRITHSVMYYETKSERLAGLKLQTRQCNILVVQVYAPNEDAHDNDKDSFYEELISWIKENKKSRDQLIIMGDFNAKVGAKKDGQIIGPYGLGSRNENGERLVDFCKQQKLIVTNTWFEQKANARHTWISPDKITKNQVDYILLSERYRNSAKNAKVRPGADCGSDHNPVILKLKTTMKKLKSKHNVIHWNREKLKEDTVKREFREQLETKIVDSNKEVSSEILWKNLKKGIIEVASQICGRSNTVMKQPWITVDILNQMTERGKLKNSNNQSPTRQLYKQMCRKIQKSCREAKEKYYKDKCEEIEELNAKHSQKLHTKIKELQQKKPRVKLGLKNKDGTVLQHEEDIKKRWHEYVKQLYTDEREEYVVKNKEVDLEINIMEEEVEETIRKLPKNKATGVDEIPAEFLQSCGPQCIKVITSIINNIYRTGEFPADFLTSVFIPIPKTAKAMKCEEHRTISLISHASKILLYIIKKRITPLIERNLTESQFGFRKGSGTRDAIYVLRTLGERMIEKKKDLFVCYIDYTKAFDRVNHTKLITIMENIGIPFYETRMISNLYWKQKAMVRCDRGMTEEMVIERGVRQGCVLSPILFNLYSEMLIQEALEDTTGVKINGECIKTIRYADDTAVVATSQLELQTMISRIHQMCEKYGMSLNIKKTKVMIISKKKEHMPQNILNITVDGHLLEQVKDYTYLGSVIDENSKCFTEVRKRIGMAKTSFWKCKEFLRRDLSMSLRKRLLECYVKSVASYGCEAWTFSTEIRNRINALQLWCYRRMLKIKYTDHITNKKVKELIVAENIQWAEDLAKRKLKFAGHVMRRSGENKLVQLVMEGLVEGKRDRGRQRRVWGDDLKEWTKSTSIGQVKRQAEDRVVWREMVHDLRLEDVT